MLASGCGNHADSASKNKQQEQPKKRIMYATDGQILFTNRSHELFVMNQGIIKKISVDELISEENLPENEVLRKIKIQALKNPQWSHSGDKIYAIYEHGIIAIDLTGAIVERIKIPRSVFHIEVVGVDDDIYYVSNDEVIIDGKTRRTANVYRYSVKNNDDIKITDIPHPDYTTLILDISVRSDQSLIAMTLAGKSADGINIWTCNPDGSNLQMVLRAAGDPQWSPDGKKLLYATSYSREIEKVSEAEELFEYDVETGESKRLTFNTVRDRRPQYSPDGKMIVFQRYLRELPNIKSNYFVYDIENEKEYQATTFMMYKDIISVQGRNTYEPSKPDWR